MARIIYESHLRGKATARNGFRGKSRTLREIVKKYRCTTCFRAGGGGFLTLLHRPDGDWVSCPVCKTMEPRLTSVVEVYKKMEREHQRTRAYIAEHPEAVADLPNVHFNTEEEFWM